MANPERRQRKPAGAILLPGLGKPNLEPSGRGRVMGVAKISYAPSQSDTAASVDANEAPGEALPRLRHFTLDRPRFKNRPPSKRRRLYSMPTSKAPPPLEDPPPVPLSAPPTAAADSHVLSELLVELPPDLPMSLPPELPTAPPPDLVLPEPPDIPPANALSDSTPRKLDSHTSLPLHTEPTSGLPSGDCPGMSVVTGIPKMTTTPPSTPPGKFETSSSANQRLSPLKLIEKSRSGKASGTRRTLTGLSGLSRSGGKNPVAAKQLGVIPGKKLVLAPTSSVELEPSETSEQFLPSAVNTEMEVSSPPEVPVVPPTTHLSKQRSSSEEDAEKSVELTKSTTLESKPRQNEELQTDSSEVEASEVKATPAPKTSTVSFKSPDIVPMSNFSLQRNNETGTASGPTVSGLKNRFAKFSDSGKAGDTASPSIVRSFPTTNSKPGYMTKFGAASRFGKGQDTGSPELLSKQDKSCASSTVQGSSLDGSEEMVDATEQEVTIHKTNAQDKSSSQVPRRHNRQRPMSVVKSATEIREKKPAPKKRFSMASLSALSPSPATQAAIHDLPGLRDNNHQLRIPAVSRPPPLNPNASTKSRSLDRRFRLTQSADVENSSNNQLETLPSPSTGRHSAPPDAMSDPVEKYQILPELPSELPPGVPDEPPGVPDEPPPDLPSGPPPELPCDSPPPVPSILPPQSDVPVLEPDMLLEDSSHVNGQTGLKTVKVQKQSWTRSLEALKSNPVQQSGISDKQTEMTHEQDMPTMVADETVATCAITVTEESDGNGIHSDEKSTNGFDFSFLVAAKENKPRLSQLSVSSGDSDLLTAVFSALKSSNQNPPEDSCQNEQEPFGNQNPPEDSCQNEQEPFGTAGYVSEPYLLDAVDRQDAKQKHYASVMGRFEDSDTEQPEPTQNGRVADDSETLAETSAKIQAASIRRRSLEASLTDILAEDLSELQRIQQEQDAQIGEHLAAIEEERRLAEELLHSTGEHINGVSSDSQDESSEQDKRMEQGHLNGIGSTNFVEDSRKSIILRPPTIYRGDLTSQSLHELEPPRDNELEPPRDDKSSSQQSFEDREMSEGQQSCDDGLLNDSRYKVSHQAIELWTTTEVADWLRAVGLEQYTPNFLDQQVNGKKLLEIDFRLLDEMDIFSPDEREQILAEIYNLSIGSEGDLASSLEDSLNATVEEEEKVKAVAAIGALKSLSGQDAYTEPGILEENEGHLPSVLNVKSSTTSSSSDLSYQTHTNVVVQPQTADDVSLPKFHSGEMAPVSMSNKTQAVQKMSDSTFSRARKLSDKFGVTESSPAIRRTVDKEQKGVIRLWLLSLQTGHEYKALQISARTSAVEVVKLLLEKLEMVDDPLRFYLAEVSNKQGVPEREVAGFECPLQLQSRWTSPTDAKFELKIRPSGVIKVIAFVPGHKSEKKAIAVSPMTSCQEVVRLALKKFSVKDNPSNYCLLECSSTNAERVIGDGEYPLMVQSSWRDANSFHLRVAPPRHQSSRGSDSVFQSPDRALPSNRPSSPPSGYSLATSSDNIETVRAQNASLWVELESLQPKVARLESLEQTVATLRSAYECLQESVAQREQHEEEEKARLQQEVEELRATNARQATQTVGVGDEAVTLIQDLEAAYSVRMSKLEDAVRVKTERVQELETENATLRDKQVKKSIDGLPQEILSERDKRVEHLQENLRSQEVVIMTLQRENAELRSSQDGAGTKHSRSNNADDGKVKALEASLSQKDGIVAAMRGENDRLQLKVQDQDKIVRDLETTVSHLQSQLSLGQQSLFTLASTQCISLIAVELSGLGGQQSGLSLADGGSSLSGRQGPGVYVRSIKKGTPADQVKKLAVGDRILEVNGKDVSHATAKDMTAALEKPGDCIKLVIGRDSEHTADGELKEAEVLSLKRHNDALSAELDARSVELDQLRNDCSRLKTKSSRSSDKSAASEIKALQQTVRTIREQLAESEQSREDLRSTLNELEQSSTSSHHQHRELQEGLQQNIYELQMRLRQAEDDNIQLEDIIREQESNIASLQKAVNEKEEALTFAETEREHAVKLLSERTHDRSTDDLATAPDDYTLATKEDLLQMLQEKEVEQIRQKAYMDQLLSLVIEHAPSVLGKLHAHEEASLKSEEWC